MICNSLHFGLCNLTWVYIFRNNVLLRSLLNLRNKSRNLLVGRVVPEVFEKLTGFTICNLTGVHIVLNALWSSFFEAATTLTYKLGNLCICRCEPKVFVELASFGLGDLPWVYVLVDRGFLLRVRGSPHTCGEFFFRRSIPKVREELLCFCTCRTLWVVLFSNTSDRRALVLLANIGFSLFISECDAFCESRRLYLVCVQEPWVYVLLDSGLLCVLGSSTDKLGDLCICRCEPKVREELLCFRTCRTLWVVLFFDFLECRSLVLLTNVSLSLFISKCDTLCKGCCLYLVCVQEPWVYVLPSGCFCVGLKTCITLTYASSYFFIRRFVPKVFEHLPYFSFSCLTGVYVLASGCFCVGLKTCITLTYTSVYLGIRRFVPKVFEHLPYFSFSCLTRVYVWFYTSFCIGFKGISTLTYTFRYFFIRWFIPLICKGLTNFSFSCLAGAYVLPSGSFCVGLKTCTTLTYTSSYFFIRRFVPKVFEHLPCFSFSCLTRVYVLVDRGLLLRVRGSTDKLVDLRLRRCEPEVCEELLCFLVRRCLRVILFSDARDRRALVLLTDIGFSLLISECDAFCESRRLYLVCIQEPWVYVGRYVCSEVSLVPCARKLGDLCICRCEPRILLNEHITRFRRSDVLGVVCGIKQVVEDFVVR